MNNKIKVFLRFHENKKVEFYTLTGNNIKKIKLVEDDFYLNNSKKFFLYLDEDEFYVASRVRAAIRRTANPMLLYSKGNYS